MRSLIVSTLAVLALSGTAAQAEDGVMRVQVGDLNVHQEPGARAALKRIKIASRQFCRVPYGFSSLHFAREIKACQKDMTGKAVAQLNAPLVTALYAPTDATQLARR